MRHERRPLVARRLLHGSPVGHREGHRKLCRLGGAFLPILLRGLLVPLHHDGIALVAVVQPDVAIAHQEAQREHVLNRLREAVRVVDGEWQRRAARLVLHEALARLAHGLHVAVGVGGALLLLRHHVRGGQLRQRPARPARSRLPRLLLFGRHVQRPQHAPLRRRVPPVPAHRVAEGHPIEVAGLDALLAAVAARVLALKPCQAVARLHVGGARLELVDQRQRLIRQEDHQLAVHRLLAQMPHVLVQVVGILDVLRELGATKLGDLVLVG
mmetsp:Transcript_17837/g.55421  ORF Transcript_17837/g.55421 Transcript_17837/m.55421 type:complete len:270 (+) Transcript_17837:208-1017(+)